MVEDWLNTLPYPIPAAIWVLGSAVLFILGGLLLDLWPAQVTHPVGRLRRTLEREGLRFWMGNLLRAAFYLGLPYLALVTGAVELDALGLGEVPAPRAVAWFLAAGLAGFVCLGAVWSYYLSSLESQGLGQSGPLATETTSTRRWGFVTLFPEALYAEAHWAFYRSLPFILWGDPYWAAAVGAVLVATETYFHPLRRRGLAHTGEGEAVLYGLSVSTITTTAYAITGNAWLSLPLHLALRWGILRWLDAARGRLARRLETSAVRGEAGWGEAG